MMVFQLFEGEDLGETWFDGLRGLEDNETQLPWLRCHSFRWCLACISELEWWVGQKEMVAVLALDFSGI